MTAPHKVIAEFVAGAERIQPGDVWTPPNQEVADRMIAAGCLARPGVQTSEDGVPSIEELEARGYADGSAYGVRAHLIAIREGKTREEAEEAGRAAYEEWLGRQRPETNVPPAPDAPAAPPVSTAAAPTAPVDELAETQRALMDAAVALEQARAKDAPAPEATAPDPQVRDAGVTPSEVGGSSADGVTPAAPSPSSEPAPPANTPAAAPAAPAASTPAKSRGRRGG